MTRRGTGDNGSIERKAGPRREAGLRNSLAHAALLSVLAFVIYANTLANGFVLDDHELITSNQFVQAGIAGIPQLFSNEYRAGFLATGDSLYRPLPLTLFAILWQFFPNDPFPGHLLNGLLYAATVFLLFLLLRRLVDPHSFLLPFLATLLFVAHPLHTEVVANIKSLDELMSLFFILLSSHFVIDYGRKGGVWILLCAAGAFFLALISKEGAISFLAIVPLLLYFFTQSGRRQYAALMAACGASTATFLLLRSWALSHSVRQPMELTPLDNPLVAAASFAQRSASCFSLLGKYLAMLVFPFPLSCDYGFHQIPLVGWSSPAAILSLLIYVSLAAIVVLCFRRRHLAVFGVAFFLVTIAPYSNLVYLIGTNFAERLAFTPSLGFCVAATAGLAAMLGANENNRDRKQGRPSWKRGLLVGVVAIAAVVGAGVSFARNRAWKDDLTLFEDVRSAPDSAHLNYWYGNELKRHAMIALDRERQQAELEMALQYLSRALQIYPAYGNAHAARGIVRFRLGETAGAEGDFLRAIELEAGQWEVYNNLGIIHAQRGDNDGAMKYFRDGLLVDDRSETLYKNIGNLHSLRGDYRSAIAAYEKALGLVREGDGAAGREIAGYLSECYERTGDPSKARYYGDLARSPASARPQ